MREYTAPFSTEQARSVEQMSAGDLVSWDALFKHCARVAVSAEQAEGLSRGDERIVRQLSQDQLPCAAQAGERIVFELAANNASLGLLEFNGSEWKLQAYMGE